MSDEKAANSRRDFLKLAAVAGPAAAVAVASGSDTAEAAAEESGSGYRKTEHVKKYLETARF